MNNRLKKITLTLFLIVIVTTMTACSLLSGNDSNKTENEFSNLSAAGYYRGHYGRSGWNDNVNDKNYTQTYPVFTGNDTK